MIWYMLRLCLWAVKVCIFHKTSPIIESVFGNCYLQRLSFAFSTIVKVNNRLLIQRRLKFHIEIKNWQINHNNTTRANNFCHQYEFLQLSVNLIVNSSQKFYWFCAEFKSLLNYESIDSRILLSNAYFISGNL